MSAVWMNGRLVDPVDATVSFDDHGITVGDGAFETIRLRGGAPFAMLGPTLLERPNQFESYPTSPAMPGWNSKSPVR